VSCGEGRRRERRGRERNKKRKEKKGKEMKIVFKIINWVVVIYA